MNKKKKKIRGNPNINRIKSHKFVQGTYKIHWKKPRGCEGECTDPKDRQIWINPHLDDKELLGCTIDEAIHATLWPVDNEYVDGMSTCIADFLYRMGFRLEKKI